LLRRATIALLAMTTLIIKNSHPTSGTRAKIPILPRYHPGSRRVRASTSASWAVIQRADHDPRAPANGEQPRLSYSRATRFQIAAPEGFSACHAAPAHTTPGVAGSFRQAYSFPSAPLMIDCRKLCHRIRDWSIRDGVEARNSPDRSDGGRTAGKAPSFFLEAVIIFILIFFIYKVYSRKGPSLIYQYCK